jgi:SRSO17 transposase
MERRFTVRLEELRSDAEIQPRVLTGMLPRLEQFLEPFVERLQRSEQLQNAQRYVAGLMSDLEAKNAEAIAYLHDQDRQPLQNFIGQSPWDHRPLLSVLGEQVGSQLGAEDAVLVFDPSAFPKKGTESVGVQRQWCGRLGKVENCQVGIYLGYVSRVEHALVDVRLYLSKEWARDKTRRKKAGVPPEIRFRTRHELALEMLDQKGSLLPHAWVSGDDEMGRSTQFRQDLRGRHEQYLLAVPSNTLVRDLVAEPPPYRGRGPRPQVPFQRVDRWCAALSADAWTTIDVRDGEKGPLLVQVVETHALARTEQRRTGTEETLVVFREQQADGSWKHDYLLSNAPLETPLAEFARVFKAQHRIEECLQRAKSEAGLADYEVRTWEGWHHHQTLSLIATWFLTQEARRGKNLDPCHHGAAGAFGDRKVVAACVGLRSPVPHPSDHESSFTPHRGSSLLPLEETQPLAAQTV